MPAISSRTPEGDSLRCPICGEICVEASLPSGDVPCPSCGQLLWLFRHGDDVFLMDETRLPRAVRKLIEFLREQLGMEPSQSNLGKSGKSFINDLGADSLDTVELVMELEEELGINIPNDVAEKIQSLEIQSLEDLIRYLLEKSLGEDDEPADEDESTR